MNSFSREAAIPRRHLRERRLPASRSPPPPGLWQPGAWWRRRGFVIATRTHTDTHTRASGHHGTEACSSSSRSPSQPRPHPAFLETARPDAFPASLSACGPVRAGRSGSIARGIASRGVRDDGRPEALGEAAWNRKALCCSLCAERKSLGRVKASRRPIDLFPLHQPRGRSSPPSQASVLVERRAAGRVPHPRPQVALLTHTKVPCHYGAFCGSRPQGCSKHSGHPAPRWLGGSVRLWGGEGDPQALRLPGELPGGVPTALNLPALPGCLPGSRARSQGGLSPFITGPTKAAAQANM